MIGTFKEVITVMYIIVTVIEMNVMLVVVKFHDHDTHIYISSY